MTSSDFSWTRFFKRSHLDVVSSIPVNACLKSSLKSSHDFISYFSVSYQSRPASAKWFSSLPYITLSGHSCRDFGPSIFCSHSVLPSPKDFDKSVITWYTVYHTLVSFAFPSVSVTPSSCRTITRRVTPLCSYRRRSICSGTSQIRLRFSPFFSLDSTKKN